MIDQEFPRTCRNGHKLRTIADVFTGRNRQQCKQCVAARARNRRNGSPDRLIDIVWNTLPPASPGLSIEQIVAALASIDCVRSLSSIKAIIKRLSETDSVLVAYGRPSTFSRGQPVPPPTQPEEWPDTRVVTLRQLWHEGHSTAEIGRRLGVPKDAVTGKVSRLGLPERTSPIVTKSTSRSRRRSVSPIANRKIVPLSPPHPLPKLRAVPADGELHTYDRAHSRCQYPLSDGKPWRFCAANREAGPYCAAHTELAAWYRGAERRE